MRWSERGAQAVVLLLAAIPVVAPIGDRQAVATSRGAIGSLEWIVLGDSYTSGEGIPGALWGPRPERCAQATGVGTPARSWAVLAQPSISQYEPRFSNPIRFEACTGKTTDAVGEQLQRAGGGPFDLATFSFGGNNVDFAGVLIGCLLPTAITATTRGPGPEGPVECDQSEPQLRARIDALAGKGPPTAAGYAAESNLPDAYESISRAMAPGGDVVVLGYPQLVEEPARWPAVNRWLGTCQGLHDADVKMLRSVTGYLNQQIALAVQAANDGAVASARGITFTFLDVSKVYEPISGPRHGLCSAEPWINGFAPLHIKTASYHPTQVGHTATSAALTTFVRTQKLRWPAAPNLSSDDLLGAPVPSVCEHPAGTLVNGELPGIPDDYGSLRIARLSDGDIAAVIADLGADGSTEGAAVIQCDQGGVPWPDSVQIWGPGPTALAHIQLSDLAPDPGGRAMVTQLSEDESGLLIKFTTTRSGDFGCCPSLDVESQITLLNGDVVVEKTSSFDELATLDAIINAANQGDEVALSGVADPDLANEMIGVVQSWGVLGGRSCVGPLDDEGLALGLSTTRVCFVDTDTGPPVILGLDRIAVKTWKLATINYGE